MAGHRAMLFTSVTEPDELVEQVFEVLEFERQCGPPLSTQSWLDRRMRFAAIERFIAALLNIKLSVSCRACRHVSGLKSDPLRTQLRDNYL